MTSEHSESDSLGMEDSLLSMTLIGAGGFIDSGDFISSRSGTDILDNGGDLGVGDLGTGDVGIGDVGTGDVGTGDLGTADLGTVNGVLTSTPKVSSSLKSAYPVSNGSVDDMGSIVMEPG